MNEATLVLVICATHSTVVFISFIYYFWDVLCAFRFLSLAHLVRIGKDDRYRIRLPDWVSIRGSQVPGRSHNLKAVKTNAFIGTARISTKLLCIGQPDVFATVGEKTLVSKDLLCRIALGDQATTHGVGDVQRTVEKWISQPHIGNCSQLGHYPDRTSKPPTLRSHL